MFGAMLSLAIGYASNPKNLAALGGVILLAEVAANHLIISFAKCEPQNKIFWHIIWLSHVM